MADDSQGNRRPFLFRGSGNSSACKPKFAAAFRLVYINRQCVPKRYPDTARSGVSGQPLDSLYFWDQIANTPTLAERNWYLR